MSSTPERRRLLPAAVLAVGLAAHVGLQLVPAASKVLAEPRARDFASYYYAVKIAEQGGNPYDVRALSALSRAEDTRRTVQPYFYPPPFLLTMLWAPPLSLANAYVAMLVLNEALLGGCLWLLHRSFGVAPWALALLLATYTPIPDNAWMGQANLIALLPALLGLALSGRRPVVGGVLVGAAAMFKMSPALFLLFFALRGRWSAFVAAGLTAVGLTVLSLPLVGVPLQLEFYREVLPGFARGDYHGLTVALNIPANHSIPDLYNHLWPGDTPTSMSERGLAWSRATNLGLLALWAWWFRRRDDTLALSALFVLMTILPAYTYEHHLVFLLLPATAVLTAAGRRGPGWVAAGLVAWFFLAWPLDWLNAARKAWPAGEVLVRESKFLALAAFVGLAAALAGRQGPPISTTEGPTSTAPPAP